MKNTLWLAVIILLVCIFTFSACDGDDQSQKSVDTNISTSTTTAKTTDTTDTTDTTNTPDTTAPAPHIHNFEEWMQVKRPTCTEDGTNERYCSCGEKQTQNLSALGHEPAVDSAVPATCTTDGKTEGTHCNRCSTVLLSQTVIPASGHTYNNGNITTQATCNQVGVKTFTCTVTGCRHSYTENYSLPTYTATELHDLSAKYIGKIVTYDKNGVELAVGTGFVMSSDGKIVTNYHVIKGARSADITINNQKYTIATVLAYDENIDLAVVKVNATDLTAATICKKPVSVGATVYAVGSSGTTTNTYSQGVITHANMAVFGVSYIEHDASITQDHSGGPLINAYGEVIGINTWGISDFLTLNLAVFAAELDKLVCGTPMTLQELYELNAPASVVLLDWLYTNATTVNENYISYDYYTNNGDKYALSYDVNNSLLTVSYLSVESNGDYIHFEITLEENTNIFAYKGVIEAISNPTNSSETYGNIDGSTFTSSSILTYTEHNGPFYMLDQQIEAFSDCADVCISWLTWLIAVKSINTSIYDLGFTAY